MTLTEEEVKTFWQLIRKIRGEKLEEPRKELQLRLHVKQGLSFLRMIEWGHDGCCYFCGAKKSESPHQDCALHEYFKIVAEYERSN